ncbi:MAG: hypothetical protein QW733_07680 [Desulfurococcaceae archaeon]
MKLGELLKRYNLNFDFETTSQTQPEPKPKLEPIQGVELPFDPQRDKARELMAGLCERVRNYGLAVYEVHYKDRLAVYWERGQESIKVYEVQYKQKDLAMIELELRHMLGLVMRADRLIAEGYSEDLVLSLLLQARDTQGRVSFVDRDNRLEVYRDRQLIKVYEKGEGHKRKEDTTQECLTLTWEDIQDKLDILLKLETKEEILRELEAVYVCYTIPEQLVEAIWQEKRKRGVN